jgi:hypothetical protein
MAPVYKFAVGTSETVNVCQSRWLCSLEDDRIHTQSCENLKPYVINDAYMYITSEPPRFKMCSVNMIVNVINILV